MSAPELWPFQKSAVERLAAEAKKGAKVLILCSPTGSGKTTTACEVIRRAVEKGSNVLHIVHLRKLVDQFSARLHQFGVDHGVLMRGHTYERGSQVQVASRDTLLARAVRNEFISLPKAKLVVVDEGRHAASPEFRSLLKHYEDQGATILLLDATPVKPDGSGLGPWAQALVEAATVSELVRDGYLVPMRVYAPDRKVGKYRKGIAGDLVASWKKYAEGQPTVLFTTRVQHSKDAVAAYEAAGIPAFHIDSETPDEVRDAVFAGLGTGAYKVVSNVGIIREGVDIPELGCTQFYMDPTSRVAFIQGCLDSETEVLGERGWLRHDTITSTDRVASYDEETGVVDWVHPTNFFSRPLEDSESMYEITSPHLDIRVSGDHSMVYRCSGATAKRWRRRTAESMASSRSLMKIPVAGCHSPGGVDLSDDEIRFVGWFLTDGSHNRSNDSVVIYQSTASKFNKDIADCLRGCEFGFSVHSVKRSGKWSKYADGLTYYVKKPGWERLRGYLDKNFSPLLDSLSPRQLMVLLVEMNKGDGLKRRNIDWTQRTMTIGTGSRVLADRLQSLCVRRGVRCNVSVATKNRSRPYYAMLICPGKTEASVGRAGDAGSRSVMAMSESSPGETIWCMTTYHNTLVTRRRGKVAIVGNCGRSMRKFGGNGILLPKKHGILIDHAGAVFRHGFPDEDTNFTLEGNANEDFAKKKADGKTEKGLYCKNCEIVYKGSVQCPECGREPTKPPKSIFAPPPIETTGEILTEAERSAAKLAVSPQAKMNHWMLCLQVAKKKGSTFGMAAQIYKTKYNEWPDPSFPHVPGAGGWKKRVADALPNLGSKKHGGQ